jgi:hypothetical protein
MSTMERNPLLYFQPSSFWQCYCNQIFVTNNVCHVPAIQVAARGASKIKLKNVNKKRMATARRQIFLEFFKASIADVITLLFSLLQNSEGGGDGDSSNSCADPCQF